MPDGVAIKQWIEVVGSLMGPAQKDPIQRPDILLLNENLLAPRLIINLDRIRPSRHGGGQAGRQAAVLCDLKRPPGGFVVSLPGRFTIVEGSAAATSVGPCHAGAGRRERGCRRLG